MGKILVVFLCFFINFALANSTSGFQESPNSTENTIENDSKNQEEIQYGEKMRELKKLNEEFKGFKTSLTELTGALARFQQSVTGTKTGAGKTRAEKTQAPETQNPNPTPGGPKLPTSCSDILEISTFPSHIKKRVYPYGNGNRTSAQVLCDFKSDGGGWTLIQRRWGGPTVDFNQSWSDYVEGFGSLSGNFWLGLDNIHTLTKNGDQELRIEMATLRGVSRFAQYSHFSISDASDFYRLSIGGFSSDSTAGDSMTLRESIWDARDFVLPKSNHGMKFTTFDQDNDESRSGNCADEGHGGWWFSDCGASQLNGPDTEDFQEYVAPRQGIIWESWRGSGFSLSTVEMKIRRNRCPWQSALALNSESESEIES